MQALYEENIARCETNYLEDTQNGNIVRGFDNYIKGAASRRRNNISDSDRIFSLSSLTYASKVGIWRPLASHVSSLYYIANIYLY